MVGCKLIGFPALVRIQFTPLITNNKCCILLTENFFKIKIFITFYKFINFFFIVFYKNIFALKNVTRSIRKNEFFSKNYPLTLSLRKYFHFFQKVTASILNRNYFYSLFFYRYSYPHFNKRDFSLNFFFKKINNNLYFFTNLYYNSLLANNNNIIIDPYFFKENLSVYYSIMFGKKIFKNFKWFFNFDFNKLKSSNKQFLFNFMCKKLKINFIIFLDNNFFEKNKHLLSLRNIPLIGFSDNFYKNKNFDYQINIKNTPFIKFFFFSYLFSILTISFNLKLKIFLKIYLNKIERTYSLK